MLNFCVRTSRAGRSWLRAGPGCLGVLLRVPQPAASSLTCAKRPGSPILGGGCADVKYRFSATQQQGGGVCCSEVKEESKGESLWRGTWAEADTLALLRTHKTASR